MILQLAGVHFLIFFLLVRKSTLACVSVIMEARFLRGKKVFILMVFLEIV